MNDTIVSVTGKARLNRRGFFRRSATGLAGAAALAMGGLRGPRAAAQSADATPAATPASAESGFAAVNGLDLYYDILGSGGTPLILLHGGLSTTELDFGALRPIFAQTRQTIGVDLQAHGHTADIDRPLRFEAMADDVAALIAYLGLEQVDIFGFSLGGGVALQTAIRHPEVVRKLVIASAPYRRDGWHPEVLNAMAQMGPEAAAAIQQTPLYDAYAGVAPRPEDWPTLVTKVGQINSQDYDWSQDVAQITAPALVAIGDADSVRPEHALELYRLLGGGTPGDFYPLPRSQFAVLAGTPHSGSLYRTDLYLPIVPRFLDAPMP